MLWVDGSIDALWRESLVGVVGMVPLLSEIFVGDL